MRLPRRALLLATAVVATVLAAPSPAATPPGLRVTGNRIVDRAGHTVVLRGVNRAGTEGGSDTSGVAASDAEIGWYGRDHSGSWHASAVRVLVGAAQWTGACPKLATNRAAYIRMIDAQVRSITRRGMVALVDLHTSTAGCTSIGRHAMPDGPVSEAFWSSAARHYAGNPLVAFELYNEPYWVNEEVWRNGTPYATFQDCDPALKGLAAMACKANAPRYRAVGMQALVNLVARSAPGHLIVVDGLNFATVPPVRPLTGPVVYGLHPYTCAHPGSCQTRANAHANTEVLNRWVPLSKRAPVWVTEFGWPSRTALREIDGSGFYSETIDFLERQQPAWGWMAFAFDGRNDGAFELTTSTSTYAPNRTGMPVYRGLRRFS